jgi:hypothetical protein
VIFKFREEYKSQISANEMLRRIFGPKNDDPGRFGYYIMSNFIVYSGHVIVLG